MKSYIGASSKIEKKISFLNFELSRHFSFAARTYFPVCPRDIIYLCCNFCNAEVISKNKKKPLPRLGLHQFTFNILCKVFFVLTSLPSSGLTPSNWLYTPWASWRRQSTSCARTSAPRWTGSTGWRRWSSPAPPTWPPSRLTPASPGPWWPVSRLQRR